MPANSELKDRSTSRVMRLLVVLSCVFALSLMPAGAAELDEHGGTSADKGQVVDNASKSSRTAYTTIGSTGPLDRIFLGNEVSVQVAHVEDGDTYEVYPPGVIPGDFGTFLVVNDVLYAPDFAGHQGTATGSLGVYTSLTPISQTPVMGTGTFSDPLTVTTEVDVGATGLRIVETNSYVIGQESFRTDIVVRNLGTIDRQAILYRALDCYLAGSDFGYGMQSNSMVGCSVNPNNEPQGRIEQLVPLNSGNQFYEARYNEVWAAIGTHQPFDNTCRCEELIDNGAGISWVISVPAGAEVERSLLTVFSPTGAASLIMTKTAGRSLTTPDAENSYSIVITNPNTSEATINSVTDTLPEGFTYVVGSTSGLTTNEPTIEDQVMTWTGPFLAPPLTSVAIRFDVRTPLVLDTYFNEATADAGEVTVAETGPTAPVTVVECLLEFEVADLVVDETSGTAEVVVRRPGYTREATVTLTTIDGTAVAGEDYTATTQDLTWNAGDGGDRTVEIPIMFDPFIEGAESLTLELSNPVGVCALGVPQTATLTIVDEGWVEFRANSTTLNQQTRPSVGMAEDGRVVVAWDEYSEDGDGWGVYAQRYSADGVAIGDVFRVNQQTVGDQRDAAVAMGPEGAFVVAWQGPDASGSGVYARAYSATGVPYGAPVLVNETTAHDQGRPAVAMRDDGFSVVVWQSEDQDGSGYGIYGRRLSPTGTPNGPERRVNQTTDDDQRVPSIAAVDGGYVAVWESYGQDGPSSGIVARRIGDGGVPSTGEWIVNTMTSGHQYQPSIAGAEDGRFAVVWHDIHHLDGSKSSVRFQYYDSAGSAWGPERQINTYELEDQMAPVVTIDDQEGIVVVWESFGQDGSGKGVFGQVLAEDGATFGGEFRANTFVGGSQHLPAIDSSGAGKFAIVWASAGQDGSGEGVYGLISGLVVLDEIFSDGFESADLSAWSEVVP